MDLYLRIRGASPEERARGEKAAKAVLDRAGLSAEEAAAGMSALTTWDDGGFNRNEEPSSAENRAASVWLDAQSAAVEACCRDWPEDRKRSAGGLELLTDAESQHADREAALKKLREVVAPEDGSSDFFTVASLADRVGEYLDDEFAARELVGGVTVAYTALVTARYDPREPIEKKRQAVLAAIDALEQATEMRH